MINFSVRWRVTAFLAAASVLNYADRAALSAVLAPLRAEFGLSDADLDTTFFTAGMSGLPEPSGAG